MPPRPGKPRMESHEEPPPLDAPVEQSVEAPFAPPVEPPVEEEEPSPVESGFWTNRLQHAIVEEPPAKAPVAPPAIVEEQLVEEAPVLQRRRKVVVGLPGREFSGNFLVSWTAALTALWRRDWEVVVFNRFDSFVPFSRMKTLGLDVLRGADQKPFGGTLEYDVWVTIDSDVVFQPEQLIELVESTDAHPVVCGAYRMADLTHYAVVQTWDTARFAASGAFQFLTPEDVQTWRETTGQKFMPVSYAGMGFMAVRREALEAMRYPYFHCDLQEIRTPAGVLLRDMCSEDVAFCKNLAAADIAVYLHTGLRVGHEKMLVI